MSYVTTYDTIQKQKHHDHVLDALQILRAGLLDQKKGWENFHIQSSRFTAELQNVSDELAFTGFDDAAFRARVEDNKN